MKRIILSLLLALLLAPSLSQAVTCCTNAGTISAPNVYKDSNGQLVLRSIIVDATGAVVTLTASGAGTTNVNVVSSVAIANAAGTAFIGSVNVSNTAQIPVDAKGSSVNASGFNFLSFTVATGLTTNADVAISLTWAAATTTGPVFYDLNCVGASGVYYIATNSATAPAGWTSNYFAAGFQPCGQISQIPLEFNAADNTHLHTIATGLSATSGTLGIVTRKRP